MSRSMLFKMVITSASINERWIVFRQAPWQHLVLRIPLTVWGHCWRMLMQHPVLVGEALQRLLPIVVFWHNGVEGGISYEKSKVVSWLSLSVMACVFYHTGQISISTAAHCGVLAKVVYLFCQKEKFSQRESMSTVSWMSQMLRPCCFKSNTGWYSNAQGSRA